MPSEKVHVVLVMVEVGTGQPPSLCLKSPPLSQDHHRQRKTEQGRQLKALVTAHLHPMTRRSETEAVEEEKALPGKEATARSLEMMESDESWMWRC